jgi:CheY-like chemotaxis protein
MTFSSSSGDPSEGLPLLPTSSLPISWDLSDSEDRPIMDVVPFGEELSFVDSIGIGALGDDEAPSMDSLGIGELVVIDDVSQAVEVAQLRVLLVDDAASTRRFLRAVVDSIDSLSFAGEAANGRDAIDLAATCQPDIILLDLSLPDVTGAQLLPELLHVVPFARVVVLSNNSRMQGPELVLAGATGYIEKGLPSKALIAQLEAVLGTHMAGTYPVEDP